ncbi:hypothetical protein BH24ACT22_BH24ACT22_15700 [soil metagenome]
MMTEATARTSTEEIVDFLRKLEVRLEKAKGETAGLRWYKRLNPARRKRLSRYEGQIIRSRRLWREGDSASAFELLQVIDERYPSVLGLIYGTPRKRENRIEVHEIREEKVLSRADIPPGGFHGGGGAA